MGASLAFSRFRDVRYAFGTQRRGDIALVSNGLPPSIARTRPHARRVPTPVGGAMTTGPGLGPYVSANGDARAVRPSVRPWAVGVPCIVYARSMSEEEPAATPDEETPEAPPTEETPPEPEPLTPAYETRTGHDFDAKDLIRR